jgi:NADH:ubiquinone oxidoreductase subunit 6 (subunit J)
MQRSILRALQVTVIVAAIALAFAWFLIVDATSHSASDTLRPWLVGVTVIALVGACLVGVLAWLSRARRS